MIITGFRIHTDSMERVLDAVHKMQKEINEYANEKFHKLLGDETAFVADAVTLNQFQRKPDSSVYDEACRHLDALIRNAEFTGTASDYNFSVHLYISQHKGYSYFNLSTPDKNIAKIFRKSVLFEDYSVSEKEARNGSEKYNIWQQVTALYVHNEPFTVNLTPQLKPDRQKITFPSLKERCHRMALYNLENSVMRMMYAGQEIPPYRLMRSLDLTLETVSGEDMQKQLRDDELKLAKLLVDLDKNRDDLFIRGEMQISTKNEKTAENAGNNQSEKQEESETAKIISRIEADAHNS